MFGSSKMKSFWSGLLSLLTTVGLQAQVTPASQPTPEVVPLEAPSPEAATPETAAPDAPAQTNPPSTGGEPQVARAVVVNEREAITRLQIFLDQQKFGAGKIDGRWGEFTAKSMQRYEAAHGLPVTPDPRKLPWQEVGRNLPLETVDPIYTTYEITEADATQIGSIPRSYAAQAKKTRMPYTSFLEFVAERFHADPALIRRLNIRLNVDNLKVGDVVWVPNVEPFKIELLKEIAKLPVKEEFLSRTIHIDTSVNMLELREGEMMLAAFPITPGSARLPAPKGTWRILGIAEFPWFRRDEKMLNEGVRSDHFYNIPPGPNSPVGVIWMGLNKVGVGIHGTNSPDTIGRSGSHGCIRLANWDVIRLAEMVTAGMTVIID